MSAHRETRTPFFGSRPLSRVNEWLNGYGQRNSLRSRRKIGFELRFFPAMLDGAPGALRDEVLMNAAAP